MIRLPISPTTATAELLSWASTNTPSVPEGGGQPMYAISFDLDTATLADVYPNDNWRHAYEQIRGVLERHGFDRQQGSVYFGGVKVTAVTTVLAVQDIARQHAWFAPAVRDIRMLRIDEWNDLNPAVAAAIGIGEQGELDI